MFKSLKEDWRRLRRGTPGRRFEDLYEACHSEGRHRGHRIVSIVVGTVLVVLGPIAGMVPGPGGIVVFAVGLALLAREFRPAARALDWCEPRMRRGGRSVKRAWTRMRSSGRVACVVVGLSLLGGCGYLVTSWMR